MRLPSLLSSHHLQTHTVLQNRLQKSPPVQNLPQQAMGRETSLLGIKPYLAHYINRIWLQIESRNVILLLFLAEKRRNWELLLFSTSVHFFCLIRKGHSGLKLIGQDRKRQPIMCVHQPQKFHLHTEKQALPVSPGQAPVRASLLSHSSRASKSSTHWFALSSPPISEICLYGKVSLLVARKSLTSTSTN